MDKAAIRKEKPASLFLSALDCSFLKRRLLSETSARRGVVRKSMDLVTAWAMIWKKAAV